MLDNKRFQQYWSELVLKILQKDSLNILLPDLETQSISNVKINFCKESYCTNFYKTIIKSLNDLSYAINLAVETFMYNCMIFFFLNKLFYLKYIFFSSFSNK